MFSNASNAPLPALAADAPTLRMAQEDDAPAISAIYAPIVRNTCISFELEPPSEAQMRERIGQTLQRLPWLVSVGAQGQVNGYAYASRHRERAAYQWAVDVSAYVHEDARGRGIGAALYGRLLALLAEQGYFQAFAGIALPNAPSVALHEAVGFAPLGVYRNVGFKHGRWHDVGWWQCPLRPLDVPTAPLPLRDLKPV
jgi:phosphinothricin acetyltransferase